MAKPRARVRTGGLTSSPNTNPGSVSSIPTGDGPRPSGSTTMPGGVTGDTLDDLLTADGRVKSYTAGFSGLTLVLKSEADKTFTLDNTEPHYGSVLSMIIAAAARDDLLTVGWMRRSVDLRIAAIGIGTEPAFA